MIEKRQPAAWRIKYAFQLWQIIIFKWEASGPFIIFLWKQLTCTKSYYLFQENTSVLVRMSVDKYAFGKKYVWWPHTTDHIIVHNFLILPGMVQRSVNLNAVYSASLQFFIGDKFQLKINWTHALHIAFKFLCWFMLLIASKLNHRQKSAIV